MPRMMVSDASEEESKSEDVDADGDEMLPFGKRLGAKVSRRTPLFLITRGCT